MKIEEVIRWSYDSNQICPCFGHWLFSRMSYVCVWKVKVYIASDLIVYTKSQINASFNFRNRFLLISSAEVYIIKMSLMWLLLIICNFVKLNSSSNGSWKKNKSRFVIKVIHLYLSFIGKTQRHWSLILFVMKIIDGNFIQLD